MQVKTVIVYGIAVILCHLCDADKLNNVEHVLVKRQYTYATPSAPATPRSVSAASYTNYYQSAYTSAQSGYPVFSGPSTLSFSFGGTQPVDGSSSVTTFGTSNSIGQGASTSGFASTSGLSSSNPNVVIFSAQPVTGSASSSLTFPSNSNSALTSPLYGGSPSSSALTAYPQGSGAAGSAPNCVQSAYNLTIPDNTAVGVIVLRVLATDPQGRPLTYTIADPVFGSFNINAQSGDITVASNLVNFARAIEFAVQVTNSLNQQCTSNVRINFIKTSSSLTAVTPSGYGYGSDTTPTPYNPYMPTGTPVLAYTPRPGLYNQYTQPTPAPTAGYGSANLIATTVPPPAPVTFPNYFNPPPAVTFPSYPSGNLVATTPYPVYNAPTPGYGSPSGNLVAVTPAPVNTYGGSPSYSGNLVATTPYFVYNAPAPGYGSPSGNLVATTPMPYVPVTLPNYVNNPPVTFPTNGQLNTGYGNTAPLVATPAPPYPVTFPSNGQLNTGYGNNAPLVATPAPLYPVTFPSIGNLFNGVSTVATIRTDNGNKALGSDGIPSSPATTMNWSFFVPNYSGTSTLVGNLNIPGMNQFTFTPRGNPFIVVDPRTADVTLASGYCPPSSPTQEVVIIQGRDMAGNGMQGNLSIVIFSSPSYVQSCQSNPVQPPTTPTSAPPQPVTSLPLMPTPSPPGAVSVTFAGDTSFTVNQCQPMSSAPAVAGSFRAKFSPNVDFSKLRITISNSLFQPALPVVCDQNFQCNITLVFSRPMDSSLQGSYLITANFEGGGLPTTSQRLQVSVQCGSLQSDQTPSVPPRTVASDPSLIVPELPPCGVASVPIDVNEDTPVGTVVASLPSTPSPGFRFQIVDASATGYFDISDQGFVAVASPLSEPTVDSVYLRVAGQINNQSVCGTDVLIGIKNVNLRKPEFDQVSYSFAADCNIPSIPIGTVTASDSDSGRNNIRRFFVNPEDTAIATIDPASGTLRLRSRLRESTSLLVFVENPGTNLRSSALVQISCTGDNSIVQLGGFGGRSAPRPTTTTQRSIPRNVMASLRVDPRAHTAVSSNQPASYPFTVSIRRS
ncbi:mucin-2-like [Paramacrobiotus metropolitanus]|uniref:mucin-2-like n=1 Tax=Paramacrobiotus metropolitanus TaxID=2943436 RepID=UPI002445C059|nr:mucin-2-like [Paramacrobiotus metropolitanus]